MKLCEVLSISNHEKIQFICVDIIIIIDKFIIFVTNPTISFKNKIIARCGKICNITEGAGLML